MRLAVLVIRSFANAGRLEELARVCHFPIAPARGMLVTLAVVARVHVRLRDWAPGVYPVGVEVQTLAEPGEPLEGGAQRRLDPAQAAHET